MEKFLSSRASEVSGDADREIIEIQLKFLSEMQDSAIQCNLSK